MGEAETPTQRERVRELGAAVGWSGEVVTAPAAALPPVLQTPGHWAYELATDTHRLHDELGFEPPVPRPEALRRTAMWECADRGAEQASYRDEDDVLRDFGYFG